MWGKTKIICSGGILRHILNSFEKVFYSADTKFTYNACQWTKAEAVKMCKHIHHKMYGDGGECRVKVWILAPKGEKTPAYFSVDSYERESNTVGV